MSHWLRITFLITFAVFWWKEVQYECPLNEECPRVEQGTMTMDEPTFTDQSVCDEAANHRETAMRTQGWNYVAEDRASGQARKAHVRYRYVCNAVVPQRR